MASSFPQGHALESAGPLTLEALAEWPLITYSEGFTGRSKVDKAFAEAGVAPDIVLSALDADVIKAYVELGLGVGIVASMAFNAERDPQLRLLDAKHLFAVNTSRIGVRRGTYLRGFAYRFIELCSPALTEPTLRASIESGAGQGRRGLSRKPGCPAGVCEDLRPWRGGSCGRSSRSSTGSPAWRRRRLA